MVNYKKMYFIMCSAADDAITKLSNIPAADEAVKILSDALLEAESIFIEAGEK